MIMSGRECIDLVVTSTDSLVRPCDHQSCDMYKVNLTSQSALHDGIHQGARHLAPSWPLSYIPRCKLRRVNEAEQYSHKVI